MLAFANEEAAAVFCVWGPSGIEEDTLFKGPGVVVAVVGTGIKPKFAGRGMISSKSFGFSQTDCLVTLL